MNREEQIAVLTDEKVLSEPKARLVVTMLNSAGFEIKKIELLTMKTRRIKRLLDDLEQKIEGLREEVLS